MIEIIPAIDIVSGQCVRLTQGDYSSVRRYGSAEEWACRFADLGLRRVHIVDLDGARAGHPVNTATIANICRQTPLIVDAGGGVRTTDDVATLLSAGVQMVNVGSVALTAPSLFASWQTLYKGHLLLCADAKEGLVHTHGWQTASAIPLLSFLDDYPALSSWLPVLITSIARDGTLAGPDIALYSQVLAAFPGISLIASGGVSTLDDIAALDAIGVPAVVVGTAIYEGNIPLSALKR